MKALQHTSHNSFGQFLDNITPVEREIVLSLRELVFECIPDCREKMAYNVPFYYRRKRICYIWPASVGWSGLKEGVDFGFSRGNLLSNESGYLESRGRKVIRSRQFINVTEIDHGVLRSCLFEAAALDR